MAKYKNIKLNWHSDGFAQDLADLFAKKGTVPGPSFQVVKDAESKKPRPRTGSSDHLGELEAERDKLRKELNRARGELRRMAVRNIEQHDTIVVYQAKLRWHEAKSRPSDLPVPVNDLLKLCHPDIPRPAGLQDLATRVTAALIKWRNK